MGRRVNNEVNRRGAGMLPSSSSDGLAVNDNNSWLPGAALSRNSTGQPLVLGPDMLVWQPAAQRLVLLREIAGDHC
jgi:hypothetical protein